MGRLLLALPQPKKHDKFLHYCKARKLHNSTSVASHLEAAKRATKRFTKGRLILWMPNESIRGDKNEINFNIDAGTYQVMQKYNCRLIMKGPYSIFFLQKRVNCYEVCHCNNDASCDHSCICSQYRNQQSIVADQRCVQQHSHCKYLTEISYPSKYPHDQYSYLCKYISQ